MKTEIAVDGTRFVINGRPTYEGVEYGGGSVEGLLFNSRMIQAIFDDENPETAKLWAYPDTGRWDPERNTEEFCRHLPEYRAHGLLAVTVGLQGGGSNVTPEVYEGYVNSAYAPDGTFKQPYFDRLRRVLAAADECGMVVIVNLFYQKQVTRLKDDATVLDVVRRACEWLLETGRRNVLVDVMNEAAERWGHPVLRPSRIHEAIEAARSVSVNGRSLLAGASTLGGDALPSGRWLEVEDISFPHGNGCTPERLRAKLSRLKESDEYRRRARPIVVNEDGVDVSNLEAALAEGCSWGFYCQGYGSAYKDRSCDWTVRAREKSCEELSGFQTVPVNWGINTPFKRAFFDGVKEITQGR